MNRIRRIRSLIILLLDLITIIGVFSITYYWRLARFPDYRSPDLWLITTTFITVLFLSGTYFKEKSTAKPALPVRTFFVCMVGGLVCIFWVYVLGPTEFNAYFGRGVLPSGTLLTGILATLIRFGVNSLYHIQEEGVGLLYLGFSNSGQAFLSELENHAEIRSVSIVTDNPIESGFKKVSTLEAGNLNEVLDQEWQGVIVDPNHHSDKLETERLVSLRLAGVPVMTLADYYEKHWFMVPVDHIGDDWFLRSQGFSMLGNPISLRIKRALDIVLSISLLLVSTPVIMICALLIKAGSQGPVFFRQTRVGLRGKPFIIIKLRTMCVDAESEGAKWAEHNDPRITKVGNFLRKSRLDELPQCWNVLKGEMSFVGPRPERPIFTSRLSQTIPYYDLRHVVKPGLTGWAQVIFPYGASDQDATKKLQYELYYIKNQSLLLDLNILIRTCLTVFQRAGR